jgi:hypothetical protein
MNTDYEPYDEYTAVPEDGYYDGEPATVAEQTMLDEPFKVSLSPGKLRDRVAERQGQYTMSLSNSSYEAGALSCYRVFAREKTNLVFLTVEEVEAFLSTWSWYTQGTGSRRDGVTWMNGPMLRAALRVKREVREKAPDRLIDTND